MAIMEVDYVSLYEALEAHRARRGVSWRHVAAEIGIPPGTFTRLKGGKGVADGTFASLVSLLGADESIRPFLKDTRPERAVPDVPVEETEEADEAKE